MFFVLFFKQKTSYEMRFSDWSSDVCSSDLPDAVRAVPARGLSAASADRVRLGLCRYAPCPVHGGNRGDRAAPEAGAINPWRVAARLCRARLFRDQNRGHDGQFPSDRKSVVLGKSVAVRLDLGGRRILIKKNKSRPPSKTQMLDKQKE